MEDFMTCVAQAQEHAPNSLVKVSNESPFGISHTL